jgi:hypothetical protein
MQGVIWRASGGEHLILERRPRSCHVFATSSGRRDERAEQSITGDFFRSVSPDTPISAYAIGASSPGAIDFLARVAKLASLDR